MMTEHRGKFVLVYAGAEPPPFTVTAVDDEFDPWDPAILGRPGPIEAVLTKPDGEEIGRLTDGSVLLTAEGRVYFGDFFVPDTVVCFPTADLYVLDDWTGEPRRV